MIPSETAELLGAIQAFDRRTVGEADVMAWHATLSDIPPDAARKAVLAHFTESKEWLMPSDIRTAVLGERRRMVAAIPAVEPPWQLADMPAEEQRWIANYRHAIADGLSEEVARTKSNYLSNITDDPDPLMIEASVVEKRLDAFCTAMLTSRPAPAARGPITRVPAMWAADDGEQVVDPAGWREAGKDFRAPCTRAEYEDLAAASSVEPFVRRTDEVLVPAEEEREGSR